MRMRKIVNILLMCVSLMLGSSLVQALESKGFDVEIKQSVDVTSLSDSIELTLNEADNYVNCLNVFIISNPIDWGEFEVMLIKDIQNAAIETDLKFYNLAKLQNNNFERHYSF